MYCPNCNKEYEGKFCPECGTMLIEKPSADGFNLNFGDANAISGGINLSDSHNVHNEDKSVHNISNVSNVTNHVTQVAAQKTEMELLQEKKSLYLNECKRAYEDNVLEQSEIIALEEYRIKIGLDKPTADSILESVRVMTERNARKTSLNPIAKTKLKILTDNLQKNEIKALMDQIDGLEALVNKYEHDELSRKYFLVLAALKPEKCINLKENSKVDSYWKSFWSYLAYIKVGKNAEAENVLVSLDRFADYPEDNMTVLAVAGTLVNGSKAEAKEYLDSVTGDYTPALQRFVGSIYLLLEPEMAKEMGADENTCAFYLVNFFNREDPKERARKEAEAKAAEEARRKAAEKTAKEKAAAEEKARKEAEAKRRCEEDDRRRAEERKRREEEARRRAAEIEAKRMAEEETRRKTAEESMLKEREKQIIYTVILKSVTNNMLAMMTARSVLNWTIAESKQRFDNLPYNVLVTTDEAEAKDACKKLSDGGMTAVIERFESNNEKSRETIGGNTIQNKVDVILENCGSSILLVTKEIMSCCNLGLKEAKKLADGAPTVLINNIIRDEAQEIKQRFERIGAIITIK